MATIYSRGGVWWGRVQRDGQDVRRSLGTRSKTEARQRLDAWVREIDRVRFGGRPRHSFDDASLKFVAEHLPALRPASRRRYGVSLINLARTLEGVALADIGRARLSEFETARRAEGVTPATVRRDLACLSSLMSEAVDWEWIDVNPVPAYMRRRVKKGLRESPPRTRWLDHGEEARLIAAATPLPARAMAFAIETGLRKEEQFALTWSRVDRTRHELEIEGKGGRLRRVPLTDRALAILDALPVHIRSPYVFHHPRTKDGPRFVHMDKALKAAARRAGIADLRWHDLRRTCGCRCLQDRGMSMEQVRDLLGHSSVVVTERSYAFLHVDQLHDKMRPRIEAGAGPGTKAGTA